MLRQLLIISAVKDLLFIIIIIIISLFILPHRLKIFWNIIPYHSGANTSIFTFQTPRHISIYFHTSSKLQPLI